MDKASIERLENLAANLHNFLELDEPERQWLEPMISKNVLSTIKLLKTIEHSSKTYEEIGDEVGLHFNTVKQKLLALKRGGFPILLRESTAICELGRMRILARKSKEP